ncbi:MAG: ABC transporter ATP-binding protein [Thermoprotei archaeon]
MSYLVLENISKEYYGKKALHNINVEIKKGELFAIAGPPGSGKTTLLKIIAGLLSPTTGRVILEGKDITHTPPYERGFSMVFEIPPIYPDRTGYENIAFPLRIRKLPENEIKRRVEEVAELLGIKHILDRKPSTYSGGEYQRVALARALVTEPRILLLDEPLKNLDAKIREHMSVWLRGLQKKLGITVIYATHDPLEAMTVGDRVMILLNGVLKQVAPPNELLLHPNDVDVDEYISIPALNIFRTKIINISEDFLTIQLNDVTLNIKKKLVEKPVSDEVFVAIRPPDILILREKSENALSAEVVLIQYYGPSKLVLMKLNKTNFMLRATVSKDVNVREGDRVYVKLPPEKIRIYDVKTKKLLG